MADAEVVANITSTQQPSGEVKLLHSVVEATNPVRPTRVETSGFELTETTVTKSSLWPPLGSASPVSNTLAAHGRNLVSSDTTKYVVIRLV